MLLAPLGLTSLINVEWSAHICNIAVQSHLSITTLILFDVLILWGPEITHGQVLFLAPSEITPRIAFIDRNLIRTLKLASNHPCKSQP